jgi:small subunit ribosomal protein S20
MANIKSQIKRVKTNLKSRERNKAIKTALKTNIKKSVLLLAENNVEGAKPAVQTTLTALDKAVSKGILHKNAAARKKSTLMIKMNELLKKPTPEVKEEKAQEPKAAPAVKAKLSKTMKVVKKAPAETKKKTTKTAAKTTKAKTSK